MALIVEDGSIVTGANTYVSEAQFTAWLTERGIAAPADPAAILLRAMDYLETLPFVGYKRTREQPLQWPRFGVLIDCFAHEENEIPPDLQLAQMFTAAAISDGVDPMGIVEPGIKRERVGAVEVEYMDGAGQSTARSISFSMTKLLRAGSGYGFVVTRG